MEFELWLGDGAEIRATVLRMQKTDRRDAEHLLELLRESVSAELDAEPGRTGRATVARASA